MAKTRTSPFGSLSYSQKIQTYVGMPIERMKETADVLQGKYTAAKENKSKLDIAIAQIDINEKDEHIRGAAKEQLNLQLNSYKEKGNWEDAPFAVQQSATDVATNGGLLAATKSKQKEMSTDAALQARVDSEKILETDKEFVQKEAQDNYKGVYKDERTGAWKGGYQLIEPPDYINIGDYTDDFITGFEADEWMGRYQNDANGYWTVGEETGEYTVDGRMIYMPSTKEATYDEIYQAARHQVLQNEQIQTRLDFELKKGGITYDDKLAADPDADKAMKAELIAQGYTKDQVDRMSNEELTDTHVRETLIHEGIEGSAIKHRFERVTTKSMGESWLAIEYKAKLAAAAGGGGSEQTVIVDQEYIQMMTQGYTVREGGLPPTKGEYETQLVSMKDDSKRRAQTIREKKESHQLWRKKNPGKDLPAGMVTEMAKMETARATHDNNIRQFEKSYSEAVDRVTAENPELTPEGIDKERANIRTSITDPQELKVYDENIARVEKLKELGVTPKNIQLITFGNNAYGYKQWTMARAIGKRDNIPWEGWEAQEAIYNSPAYAEAVNEMNKLGAEIYATDSYVNDYQMNLLGKYQDVAAVEAKLDGEISEELARMSTANTIQYAYLNLSVEKNKAGRDGESTFSRDASDLLRKAPHAYIHIGTDGQEQILENSETPEYNVNNITMLGPTTDYVHGHGVLFYGSEVIMKEDGKTPTGEVKMHLFKDPSGGMKQLALNQMQKGRLIKNSKVDSEKGFNAMDDVIYKYVHEEVDKQVAYFQTLPEIAPPLSGKPFNADIIQVTLGPNKYADVERRVYKDGSSDYHVTPRLKSDENKNPWTGGQERYSTISLLENALEEYGGVGPNSGIYQVSMSTLSKVTEAEIPYGKFKAKMGSMPRLEEDFKNEFIALGNTMKLPFTITSMTRSIKDNKDIGGHENSGHLYGKGVDIRSEDAEGKAVVNWLKANSTLIDNGPYSRVNGMDLIYQVHDVKTGMHIDLKYSKQ